MNSKAISKKSAALLGGACATTLSLTCAQANAEEAEKAARDISEEVVVVARKREERLQEVPLSVQAFNSSSLENERIDNVENLVGKVPNLSLSSNLLSPGSDFINISIRGVGAQSTGVPAVGTFVDGAFVPALSFDIGFMDVERVEVLRGPQGTLFGRNTQGGALNIVLRRPDEESRGKVAVTVDEFETFRTQAAVSGQIGENVFGSLAVDVSNTDGYLENPVVVSSAGGNGGSVSANDQRRFSWRTGLRFTPSDNLDINVALDSSRRTGLDGLPGVPRGLEEYTVRSDFQIDSEHENDGITLNIDYTLGDVDLTSVTAYRKVSSRIPFDFDGSPERGPNIQDFSSEQELFSQELRLSGSFNDDIDWLAGVYGFQEDSLTRRSIQFNDLELALFGGFPFSLLVDAQDQSLDRSGFAVFTDVVWRVTDKLELNAGLRYADEKVDSFAVLDFTALALGLDIDEVGTGSISDSNASPTVSVRYNFHEDLTGYIRFARGFRAGGFPVAPVSAVTNLPFNSEQSDNYEIGLKGSAFDGQFRFGLSVFDVDIEDQQLTTLRFINDDPNLPVASVDNAGESRTRGFEANLTLRASDSFEFGTSFGYTDAEYVDYIDTVGTNRTGERFPFVPEWSGQAYGTYSTSLGDWDMDLTARYRYVGDILSGSGVDIDVQFPVDSYDVIDLNASFTRDNWQVDLFVDNVTDDFIETRVFNAFFFPEDRPFSIVLPPRRTGVRVSYNF